MCFRKKFNEIKPNLNITTKEIITVYTTKKKGIKIGTKLFVPRDFAFVLLSGDKILQIFKSGEYVLDKQTVKESIQKLNMFNSKKIKYIPVSAALFLNLHDIDNLQWQTIEKIELENKKFGVYKISASGNYSLKIEHIGSFLQHFLKNEYLSDYIVKDEIENIVNINISKQIYDENYSPEILFEKDEILVENAIEMLQNKFIKMGIDVLDFTFENIDLPSKVLKNLQIENVAKEENSEIKAKKKNKFVTVEPTGGKKNFFKESMAPFFFDDEEETYVEEEKKEDNWKGVIEKEKEKKSKNFVNLDEE